MAKRKTYYKLGDKASVFWCPISKLKVTKNQPGCTDNISKLVKESSASGHIISISEDEYNRMLNIKKSEPLPTQAPESESEDEGEDNDIDQKLYDILGSNKKVKAFKKDKTEDEIKAFIEENS